MTKAELTKLSQAIVGEILTDMTDRRGLRQSWDAIDRPIKVEIRRTWEAIVLTKLLSANPRAEKRRTG